MSGFQIENGVIVGNIFSNKKVLSTNCSRKISKVTEEPIIINGSYPFTPFALVDADDILLFDVEDVQLSDIEI